MKPATGRKLPGLILPKLSTGYSYTKLDQPPEMRFVSTQSTPLQSLVMGTRWK